MSTRRPVDRSAVTIEKGRSAVTIEKDRFTVTHEKDRSAVTIEKGRHAVTCENDRTAVTLEKNRSAVTRRKDRAGLCSFTFANGHCCRTPLFSGHPHLCHYHARKEAQARAADEMGRDISYFFSGKYLSACDLSSALGRLFAAAAQGQVKLKTASTLAYLGQTLVQTIQLSQREYINAFGIQSWRETIHSSVNDNSDRQNQELDQATAQDQQPHTDGDAEPDTASSK